MGCGTASQRKWVHRDQRGLPDRRGQRGQPVPAVQKGLAAPKAYPGLQGLQVRRVNRERLAQAVHPAQPV